MSDMKLTKYIRLYGALDIVLFFSIIISDIWNSKVPFYSNLKESLNVDQAFGGLPGHVMYVVSIIGFFAILSSVISGVLMLVAKKMGVYISFVQAPFRLLLIMPPTFFFVAKIKAYFPNSIWIFTGLVLLLEIAKIVSQVLWLRNIKIEKK